MAFKNKAARQDYILRKKLEIPDTESIEGTIDSKLEELDIPDDAHINGLIDAKLPNVSGVDPIADPNDTDLEEVATALNALISALS